MNKSDPDCGGEMRKRSDGRDCMTCLGRGCQTKQCSNFSLYEPMPDKQTARDVQVGGDHYRRLRIQPVEYIYANNLNFLEGCIVKRISRWRNKTGKSRFEDLEKIKHEIDLLIEMESKDAAS